MDDIYNILAKHFFNETNPEEEKRIDDFRENNTSEYEILRKLWERGGIKIHHFNTKDAWKKIQYKTTRKSSKTIFFQSYIRSVAAVVIFLIVSSVVTLVLTDTFNFSGTELTKNKTDELIKIDLADGSFVWLNRSASLSFPDEFKGKYREVNLSGTAFFDIAKDKKHPFIINTTHTKVTVLGTSFNVNSTKKVTEVTVQSGTVEVMSLRNNEKVIIKESQSAIVKDDSIFSFETNNPNYLSWKTGIFEFYNTPISQVVKDLNTYYHNQLEINQMQSYDCNLTAKFDNARLEDIIELLETTCNLSIEKENKVYKIK